MRVRVLIDVDVVLVNMDERTAYCSDGVTRSISQLYDSQAQLTENPDDAIAAVVEVADGQFIVLNLAEDNDLPLH